MTDWCIDSADLDLVNKETKVFHLYRFEIGGPLLMNSVCNPISSPSMQECLSFCKMHMNFRIASIPSTCKKA